jgi:hypothetical protein
MALLLPIVAKPAFLSGWQAECRYETNMLRSAAETRFHLWNADVDSLFTAAGIP